MRQLQVYIPLSETLEDGHYLGIYVWDVLNIWSILYTPPPPLYILHLNTFGSIPYNISLYLTLCVW